MLNSNKLTASLISRLRDKLPLNSNVDISYLKHDLLLMQIVESLLDISLYQRDVLSALCNLLDSTSKSFNGLELDDFNTLHSQLFLLRLITITLTCSQATKITKPSKLTFLSNPTNDTASNTLPRSLLDPNQLDDVLAKFLLNIITKYFITTSTTCNSDTASYSFNTFSTGQFTDYNGSIPAYSTSSSSYPPSSIYTNNASWFSNLKGYHELFDYYPTNIDVFTQLQKAASRIVFFLSMSNWSIVFQKIRFKITQICQRGGEYLEESREENDLTELRLIEWTCLNRERLSSIINEFALLKQLPKKVQVLSSLVYSNNPGFTSRNLELD